ncbi:hypothetical protein BJX61DRAFT_500927 [Aspergillus egyptiacus]|nr:hypothetical protein BJX61DRAFT_500927 [Aspergillus egyptiacus]
MAASLSGGRDRRQECIQTRPCCLTGKIILIVLPIIASACSLSSVLFAPHSLTDKTVLFHREKHICRFSGISQIVDGDYDFLTRQAPWDEHTAIIRSSKSPCLKNALATALMYENRHLSGIERLTCLMVHARCWQLLCKHRIWSLCRGDIKFVMRALYRADLHREHQPLISLEDPFVRLRDDTDQDPFYSNRVQSIIRQAGRRTRTQYQDLQYRHKMVYLSRLPPEILLLIANLLPSTDAAAVQKAVGSYLGDTYWRSRIPDMFYEVQDLSTESLNWEYLCLGLERLKSSWDIYYPCRKEAWDTLDAIVQFIGDDFNNA